MDEVLEVDVTAGTASRRPATDDELAQLELDGATERPPAPATLAEQIGAGVQAALEAAGVAVAVSPAALAEAVSVALDAPPATAVDSPA